jgi:hypothetical protein
MIGHLHLSDLHQSLGWLALYLTFIVVPTFATLGRYALAGKLTTSVADLAGHIAGLLACIGGVVWCFVVLARILFG